MPTVCRRESIEAACCLKATPHRSIVRRLVDMRDRTLTMESQSNRGSVFGVALPFHTALTDQRHGIRCSGRYAEAIRVPT
jgi:hypothetical protein